MTGLKIKIPHKSYQIGGGHWRIADRKKPNGEWDYRNLANGHGIYADTIFSGTIAGGSNYWNLDTGQLVFRQGSITINGPYSTQVTINPNDGFRITQYGQLIGGIEIINGVAHVRAQRVGSNPYLYLTTGQTSQGNPGASLINLSGTYLDLEATRNITAPLGSTTGVGFSVFRKPFFWSDTYTPYTKIQAPVRTGSYLDADADTGVTVLADSRVTISAKSDILLMAPKIAVSTDVNGIATETFSGEIPIITKIEDAGNGAIQWWKSSITVVNGLIVSAPRT